MGKPKKVNSREVGLEIGLVFGKYFLGMEHLHYGYWTDGLEVNIHNLSQAQKNYSGFLLSHIPEGTKTILDVGCGNGRFALELINKGYKVDCVSPSSILTGHAQNILRGKSHIFECYYEDLETENRYDLILFSESFQYINLEKALQKSLRLLNKEGYLLICDFFKTNAEGKSMLGGGHRLVKFYDLISQYSFHPIKDIDITKETLPNLKVVSDFFEEVGNPIWDLVLYFLNNNYPLFSRFLQWKYKKKIEKIERKYFSGGRNAENFSIFKSYRLLLYKKKVPDII